MPAALRPIYNWQLHTRSLPLGTKTLVMGVLNATPDSFSDGGLFFTPARAIARAITLLDEGADILDVGGESTRPGTRLPVSAQQEIDRTLPVIEGVMRIRPETIFSIDTYKAETAHAAVRAGAQIVNDVSAFQWDEAMADTCARLGCGVILMHTRGRSGEWRSLPPIPPKEVLPLVRGELEERVAAALEAGVSVQRLVIDPGFGFGKVFEENYPLLAHFDELHALGFPLLAATSRKAFLGRTLAQVYGGVDAPADKRLHATIASVTAAILGGAHIVRVHDVKPTVEAAAIADAIRSCA